MKLIKRIIIFITLSLVIVTIPVKADTKDKSVTPTIAYSIVGLNHNLNVQNFYIGSKYLYVTQKSGTVTYLSRCTLNGTIATYKDEMTLLNCGHGQTLEYMEYQGDPYFLVGCKANKVDNYIWSTQIGVIQYSADKILNYTSINRFTYMNYANKTATSIGTTKRVAAATSQNNNLIIFRIQNTDNNITYSIYNRDELLTKLFTVTEDTDKKLDMRTTSDCCLYSFTQTASERVWPNKSFQGLEMTGTSNIYVSGGGEGQIAGIAKMNLEGKLQSTISIKGVPLTANSLTPEIEGLQAKRVDGEDRLYFVLPYYNKNSIGVLQKKGTQKIYYIKENDF